MNFQAMVAINNYV